MFCVLSQKGRDEVASIFTINPAQGLVITWVLAPSYTWVCKFTKLSEPKLKRSRHLVFI